MGFVGKMRGALRGTGRCTVPGHGQACSLTREIRDDSMDRAREKRAWRDEVEAECASLPSVTEEGRDA